MPAVVCHGVMIVTGGPLPVSKPSSRQTRVDLQDTTLQGRLFPTRQRPFLPSALAQIIRRMIPPPSDAVTCFPHKPVV